MPARVVFLRSKSPAGIEPRLAKEAATLVRAGYEVHAVLWDRTRSYASTETLDGIRIHRYQLPAPEGDSGLALRLPRWWAHAALATVSLRPDVVHAVDFDTAWPARIAAHVVGAKLVYDIFDFYSEMITADLPVGLRRYLASAERRMVASADLVILPDLRRQAQFARARPRKVVEIMNVPEDQRIPADLARQFTVFYGGMIAKDRGLMDLLAACEATGAKLIVAGHGPDEAELLPHLESSPASLYLGTIPYEDVLHQTAAAHAIAALYDPRVPNNRFAAPNKVYEAMMFSKPVLVSEGIAVADLVRSVDCGLVIPYGDRAVLRAALEQLMLSPRDCQAMGGRGRAAFESGYNWKVMEARLLGAYRELLAA
jgi:glycosyltransferase involved in cell wall biosynthesis